MALGTFEWWQPEKCQNLAFCAKLPLFSDPITNVYLDVYYVTVHARCTCVCAHVLDCLIILQRKPHDIKAHTIRWICGINLAS